MDEDAARGWLAARPEWDRTASNRIDAFLERLGEENAHQNLVAAQSLSTAWSRHILDSAQLLDHVSRETSSWLDLGTGAGFPGIVIAILRPDLKVWLVESRARRIAWLGAIAETLSLKNVVVEGARLERVQTRTFNVISARAFAPLPKLLDLSSRFSTTDTIWLLPKGQSATQELENLRGWRHSFHVKQSLSDAQSGIIVGNVLGRKGKHP